MSIYVGQFHNGKDDEDTWFGAYRDKQTLIREMGEYILLKLEYMDNIDTFYYMCIEDVDTEKENNEVYFCTELGIDYDQFQEQKNNIETKKDFTRIFQKQLCDSLKAINAALDDTLNHINILKFDEKTT